MIGRQAIVVGAGIGGLTAARVLADHFERVLVLERDALPIEAADRPSIPQGRYVHALLRGGQNALEELLPGFERALATGGAVLLRAGLDLRVERPGFDPFPQRDLGIRSYAMSRPLLELTVRGDEAIATVRQKFTRKQLIEATTHTIHTEVTQRETWTRTPLGWKLVFVDDVRDHITLDDGVRVQ